MNKDLEPNDQQSNNEDSRQLSAEDTIEIKVADHRLPRQEDNETNQPTAKTRMVTKRQIHQASELIETPEDDVKKEKRTVSNEAKSRTQRRQMEVRESLMPTKTMDDDPKTREEKRKKEQDEETMDRKGRRLLKVRLFPIWLRLLLIMLLALIAVVAGAMIGYGVLGKGNPMDIFNQDTWSHIRDIVIKTK